MDRRFIQRRLTMGRWLCVVAILFASLSLLFVSSCSTIDCPVENTVAVQYEIRDKAGKPLEIQKALSVLTEAADGTDVLVLNQLKGKSSFSLPISYSHPEDVLYFGFIDGEENVQLDTVWIQKDDIPHFESVDCFPAFFHELTSVKCTHHAIDSLVLINTSVTYDVKTIHFHLYPKTGN